MSFAVIIFSNNSTFSEVNSSLTMLSTSDLYLINLFISFLLKTGLKVKPISLSIQLKISFLPSTKTTIFDGSSLAVVIASLVKLDVVINMPLCPKGRFL